MKHLEWADLILVYNNWGEEGEQKPCQSDQQSRQCSSLWLTFTNFTRLHACYGKDLHIYM